MVSRKFKYRLDSSNKVLFKEEIQNTYKGEETKIRALLGVKDDFSITEPVLIRDAIAHSLSDYVKLEGCTDTVESLTDKINSGKVTSYIDLSKVNYLATLNLTLVGEDIVKNRVNLYIPLSCNDNNELICTSVDTTLSEESLNMVLENAKKVVMERIN